MPISLAILLIAGHLSVCMLLNDSRKQQMSFTCRLCYKGPRLCIPERWSPGWGWAGGSSRDAYMGPVGTHSRSEIRVEGLTADLEFTS